MDSHLSESENTRRLPIPNVVVLSLMQALHLENMMTGIKCFVETGSERVFVCGWQAK